jgi:hypothetical protein
MRLVQLRAKLAIWSPSKDLGHRKGMTDRLETVNRPGAAEAGEVLRLVDVDG